MSKPRFCCVPCCKNAKFTLVHKFPSHNERAEQWRQALAIDSFIGLPIDVIRKRHYVCSRHFRDSDYKNKASRSINTTAVPSINLFALTDAEGLNRKIPSPVRVPMGTYPRSVSLEEAEQGQQEIVEEAEDYDDVQTIELTKAEAEFMIPSAVQHQQVEKSSSSITHELNNFIEESFTSDPTITMTTITKNTLLAPAPSASGVKLEQTIGGSPTTIVSKRTILKRPHSTIYSIGAVPPPVANLPKESHHPAAQPMAKQAKLVPYLLPTALPAGETVVLKRIKIGPFAKERKHCATSCAMTQTDAAQPELDSATTDGDGIDHPGGEGIDNVSATATHTTTTSTSTSTKVLALLECTPENLQRLQRKLNDQGGALCLDERLLGLGDEETGSEGDKAMSPSKSDDKAKFLTIRNAQTQDTASVSYVWLRDHCRCAECYNATTFQRSYSILDLPLDVQPSSCNIDNERIDITWKDGHQSSYDLNEIFDNQLDTFRKRLDARRSQQVLWDRALITDGAAPPAYARVTLNDLLCEDEVMRQVVGSLVAYGFAFITKVPPNQQSTEMAVKRIFPIQRTLFGEMWTFSDDKMDHSDTAYTNGYLGPHTDNTYFSDAAGLQVLHCIQFNGKGAETILVDGFRATERLRDGDPDAFERLCDYPLEAEYIEEDKHHRYVAPVIKRHPLPCSTPGDDDGRSGDGGASFSVEQIRFNPYDRAPLRTLAPSAVPQFYADYQRLAREIYSEELQWRFQLTPGTVLLFDNWRVLHGRMAYNGKRVMTGCYVARTEYQSVARTMGLIE